MKTTVIIFSVLLGILLAWVLIVGLTFNFLCAMALPSEPDIVALNAPQESRYGFTEEDICLLSQLLCGDKTKDGDGEYDFDFATTINYYEIGKVLNVVMNRVRSDIFPNTVKDVILQAGQFSVMPKNSSKEPSAKAIYVVTEWCKAYDSHLSIIQIIPEDHLYFSGNGTINITRATYQ